MSYDLYFWREIASSGARPEDVCALLCEEQEPEGLAWLSVADLKGRFAAAFPGIRDGGTELNWEGEESYFQVSWPVGSRPGRTLGIFVHCGYPLLESPDTLNRVIEIAGEFGCALYDPQTGKRYNQADPKRD
jgi:hypothetical protein